MGKGRIVSGGEDGLYTVELLHNRERIDAEIDFLAAKLAELQAELDALEAEREEFVAERNAIATEIDQAVDNVSGGEIPDVEALLVELSQVSAQIQAQDVRIGMLKGRKLEAEKRKQQLESVPADPQQQAWCADYTEDLTGEVATVEVPAEGVVGEFATWRRVQIRPGYEGRANYLPARDGQMLHREGQAGYQAYFNAAILPGVQRWRPQYRIGVITSIDNEADTCSLTIQGEDSSAQSLIIDPPDSQYTKTGVPIEYMSCDAAAFEVGDRVLVEFQDRDWQQPRVIGFEKEPKPCFIIMAYNLGISYTFSDFQDSYSATGYPVLPSGVFRDRGVTEVGVGLWGGDGLALLYDRNLQEVIDATVISELPEFAALDVLSFARINKGSFSVPTTSISRNAGDPLDVPWIGTKSPPGGGVFPNNKPPDPFELEPESLEVTFRQYRAQNFQFYNDGGIGRVYWSNQADTGALAGEVTVTMTLDEFPQAIGWQGAVYNRKAFVNFVPFDFDNDRGESDQWFLDRICIRYEPE